MQMLCRRKFHFNIKKRILWRISVLRRCVRSILSRFRACCWVARSAIRYRHLAPPRASPSSASSPSSTPPSPPQGRAKVPSGAHVGDPPRDSLSSDLVALKIGLFGDCRVGKTSFLRKYAGEEKGGGEEMAKTRGLHHVDKTMYVKGARISYSIWEVGGDHSSFDQIRTACKDSVAMLFMFDLTSRCTMNSVIQWYQEARKWNQNAFPVLVGTKFDEFIQLPIDLQWTIASQARAYAKAMNATLFFSSATYNINVNKIFKFVAAKLFNLSWNLERNLTLGEPMIDF